MKKYIWIGPLVNLDNEKKNDAISPAANSWQESFIEEIRKKKLCSRVITYKPERVWPYGPLIAKSYYRNNDIKIVNINYINILYLRELWLAFSIILVLWRLCKASRDCNQPKKYLVFYNCEWRHTITSMLVNIALYRYYIPLAVVADHLARKWYDGYIFLSYHYYYSSSFIKKFHFDGGIDLENIIRENGTEIKKYLMYSGAITEHGGILDFVRTYSSVIYNNGIELYISGSGSLLPELLHEIETKPYIKYLGFLAKDELNKICFNSLALINPRPIIGENAENNFPSKIHFYTLFERPIISTRCLGLSPKYDLFLYYYDDENTLLDAIVHASRWRESTKYDKYMNFRIDHTWKKNFNILNDVLQKSFR